MAFEVRYFLGRETKASNSVRWGAIQLGEGQFRLFLIQNANFARVFFFFPVNLWWVKAFRNSGKNQCTGRKSTLAENKGLENYYWRIVFLWFIFPYPRQEFLSSMWLVIGFSTGHLSCQAGNGSKEEGGWGCTERKKWQADAVEGVQLDSAKAPCLHHE